MRERTTKRVRRALLFTLLGLLCLHGVASAEKPPLPTFGEVLDVRVIGLEVKVTQRGEPVHDLRPGDFRVEVDGKPQPITGFTEIQRSRLVSEDAITGLQQVGTHYLIFVDEFFTVTASRNRVLDHLSEQLVLLRPEDSMAVVSFDGKGLSILGDWSRTPKAALAEARERPCHGLERLGEQRRAEALMRSSAQQPGSASGFASIGFNGSIQTGEQPFALGLARTREIVGQVEQVMRGAAATLRGLERPPGRKVMVLLLGPWPVSPDDWLLRDDENGGTFSGVAAAQRLMRPLVQTANRLGYTLYPVEVPAWDRKDTSARLSLGDARQERERKAYQTQTEETLQALATATGGKAFTGRAMLEVMPRVVEDTRSYYLLDIAPTWRGADKSHEVEVKVAQRGLTVRCRASFMDLSRRREIASLIASAELFGTPLPGESSLAVALGPPSRAGRGRMEVPLRLEIAADARTGREPPSSGLELRVGSLDDLDPDDFLPAEPIQLTGGQPIAAGRGTVYETRLDLSHEKQDLLISVYDPRSGTVLAKRVKVEPSI